MHLDVNYSGGLNYLFNSTLPTAYYFSLLFQIFNFSRGSTVVLWEKNTVQVQKKNPCIYFTKINKKKNN